uniref:Uncharacterized protein n=1 Tax=Plectus sambesii TaxID=2011161 RepID=A0A914WNV4_9BILA
MRSTGERTDQTVPSEVSGPRLVGCPLRTAVTFALNAHPHYTMIARLLAISVSLASFAFAAESNVQVTTAKPAIGDNLALNLADAVIKSFFPEVDKVKNPPANVDSRRRAPVRQFTADGLPAGYSQYSAYPIPPGDVLPNVGFAAPRLEGRTDLPASYVYPYAAPGSIVQPIGVNGDQPFFLGPQSDEQLVSAQNRQYLQQQQQSLRTQEQIFLQKLLQTQQRRLLLAQTQPQLSAERQQQFNPYFASLDSERHAPIKPQPQLAAQSQSGAEDKLGTLYGTTNVERNSESASATSASNADEAYLKELFKAYGVDLSKGLSRLTTDDNETLALLKEHLTQQQLTTEGAPFVTGDSENSKEPVLKEIQRFSKKPITSPSTAAPPTSRFSSPKEEEESVTDATSVSGEEATSAPPAPTDEENVGCDQCIPIDLAKTVGAWTQIYGNPDVMRQIYSTVQSIQDLELTSDTVTAKMIAVQPSCIGFQLGQPVEDIMELDYFFRDDSESRKLTEMKGILERNNKTDVLNLMLSALRLPMCAVLAEPTNSPSYEYLVLMETTGANRCRSQHVFARNAKTFFREYNTEVADFLETAIIRGNSLPVAVLPFSRLCQLPTETARVL